MDGFGIGAWMLARVPWVWRHRLQWQKCVGRGRAERGMVKESWEWVQWHVAVRVRVSGWCVDGGMETDMVVERRGVSSRWWSTFECALFFKTRIVVAGKVHELIL
jgi:hypothetical protein